MPNACVAFAWIGERRREQRQTTAGASSAPNAPWNARAGVEHGERRRGTADRRRDGEADQADEERALAAEDVGDAATEQQKASDAQRVRGV